MKGSQTSNATRGSFVNRDIQNENEAISNVCKQFRNVNLVQISGIQ